MSDFHAILGVDMFFYCVVLLLELASFFKLRHSYPGDLPCAMCHVPAPFGMNLRALDAHKVMKSDKHSCIRSDHVHMRASPRNSALTCCVARKQISRAATASPSMGCSFIYSFCRAQWPQRLSPS
jgi:hypothetical protein